MSRLKYLLPLVVAFLFIQASCKKNSGGGNEEPPPPPPIYGYADVWTTFGNKTSLLKKQAAIAFVQTPNAYPNIDVDSSTGFQTVDGFGYTLTGGSAFVINQMPAANKSGLLRELFSEDDNSIKVSYLRISIGASDLDAAVFSYDDLAPGETDLDLAKFSLAPDRTELIPLLKAILAIRPTIKIIATPWSPPVWMKDNGSTIGGRLKTEYYDVYAKYFVKYIQQMQAEGITINAVTPQNEPLNPGNNPSMEMSPLEQANFIKNNLGPAFRNAGINTKIIIYDHNCDKPEYPLAILSDPAANEFIDGSAFHLYSGDIGAMSTVHNQFPTKNLYFTEQYTSSTGDFGGDLKWHLKNVIIGSLRNFSRIALEWNLANDPSFGPHTPGGCNTCLGALTISGSAITRNVAYYIIGQVSKFVPEGSVRISSNNTSSLNNVAFRTPSGKKVLVVLNDGSQPATFNIKYKGNWATATLPEGGVGTYTW